MRCASLLRLCLLATAPLAAKEWHVGPHEEGRDIAAALAAAQAHDVIIVHGGIHRDAALVIDRPLTLVGLDRPSIQGPRRGDVIRITAPHVTLRGFRIGGSGASSLHDFAGIKVENTSHVTVEDNEVLACTYGIYLSRTRDALIHGNTVRATPTHGPEQGNGIHAWSCERLDLARNVVERHRDGIYLEYVSDSLITANRVADNLRYGLHFMTAHRNVYRQNHFLRNGAGVAVMYSRGVQMEANRFSHSWGSAAYGLLLKEISDSRIAANLFEFNSVGVTIQNSTRMIFDGNQFRENGWALQVESSSTDNVYRKNNFTGNAFDLTSNGALELNRFEGNYWDRAELYDLDRDGVGDVPYRPLSLFARLIDRVPAALLLLRSPLAHFLDRAERIFPSLTPDRLIDPHPAMRPYPPTKDAVPSPLAQVEPPGRAAP